MKRIIAIALTMLMLLACLPAMAETDGTVLGTGKVTRKVTVYEENTTRSSKLGTLAKNSKINVLDFSGSYVEIEFNDDVGYVNASYIDATFTANVLGEMKNRAYIYTTRSTSSKRRGPRLAKETEIQLTGRSGSWWTVKYDDKTYYARVKDVNFTGYEYTAPTTTPTTSATPTPIVAQPKYASIYQMAAASNQLAVCTVVNKQASTISADTVYTLRVDMPIKGTLPAMGSLTVYGSATLFDLNGVHILFLIQQDSPFYAAPIAQLTDPNVTFKVMGNVVDIPAAYKGPLFPENFNTLYTQMQSLTLGAAAPTAVVEKADDATLLASEMIFTATVTGDVTRQGAGSAGYATLQVVTAYKQQLPLNTFTAYPVPSNVVKGGTYLFFYNGNMTSIPARTNSAIAAGTADYDRLIKQLTPVAP